MRKGEKQNQANKPRSYKQQLSYSNKPVLWSWNNALLKSKLSSSQLQGGGLILGLRVRRQGSALDKRTRRTCRSPNRLMSTTTAPLLYRDTLTASPKSNAFFLNTASHLCIRVWTTKGHIYYTPEVASQTKVSQKMFPLCHLPVAATCRPQRSCNDNRDYNPSRASPNGG